VHRASRFVAEAANELRLGTPIVADGDALFESTNDRIVSDDPDLAGMPLVTSENAGFKARRSIGTASGAGIDVDVNDRLLALSTGGESVQITERDGTFLATGELDSGDLAPFVPPLAGTVATPAVDLAFGNQTPFLPEENPEPDQPEQATSRPDPGTPSTGLSTSDPEPPTVVEAPPPPEGLPPFGTLARQRIERARSAVLIETATARVTAVQFGEFYFLHEKMQISEYANDLDLYFVDYLVFGVAEVTADPRIPHEVKGQIIYGGPRPYQL
jgi:hypothetical protein